MNIKEKIEQKLPQSILELYRKFKFKFGFKAGQLTYSQEGEDLILIRLFANKRNGFYVDVGAHHPYRYSNTYLMHKLGWKGINIDGSPVSVELFRKSRKRDININVLISNDEKMYSFYMFNDGAYNTLSEDIAMKAIQDYGVHLIDKKTVGVKKLEVILDDFLPAGRNIDFLNVDVEGFDLDVLASNNWEKYSPTVIAVEIQWKSIEVILKSDIYKFLLDHGYHLYSKLVNTAIFIKSQ